MYSATEVVGIFLFHSHYGVLQIPRSSPCEDALLVLASELPLILPLQ